MLEINLSFAPYASYDNAFVELTERQYNVPITLVDGTHTCTSENLVVGSLPSFENRPLRAHLTFQYTYDELGHVITVSGTDFASAHSISLVTFPEGTSELCRQRAVASAGFAADDLTSNPHWNYRTPLMPGLEDVLRGMVRQANDSLIAALQRVENLTVRVRKDPPALSAADYQQLLAVYRKGAFHGRARDHRPGGQGDADGLQRGVHPADLQAPQRRRRRLHGGTSVPGRDLAEKLPPVGQAARRPRPSPGSRPSGSSPGASLRRCAGTGRRPRRTPR
jgi:hypothetical protein